MTMGRRNYVATATRRWQQGVLAGSFVAMLALASAARALEPSPTDSITSEALALVTDEVLDPAERVKRLEAITEANPQNGTAWAALGEARMANGEDRTALAAFDRAVEIDPTLFTAWYQIGTINKRLALDFSRAEQAFLRALELGSNPGPTYNELGVTLARQRRFKDALRYFDRGIAADPDWGVLYNNAIKAALADDSRKLARQYFLRSLDAKRFEESAVMLWGEWLVSQGDADDAAEDYALALKKHPGNLKIRYYYGAALKDDGETKDAIRELEATREAAVSKGDKELERACDRTLFSARHPKDEKQFQDALARIFRQHESQADLRKALETALPKLDELVQKHPSLYNLYYVRGYALRMLDQRDAARSDFEKALQLYPAEPNACMQYALLLRDEKDYEAAVRLAEMALQSAPNDPSIIVNAGFIYLDGGNCAKARECADKGERFVGPDGVAPLREEIAIRCR